MYGRAFESMYEGSMYGAGVAVFAVWGYVIAKGKKGIIELNPKKLADTLGGTEKEIREAIEYLMKPDPNSRFKEEDGKRLVKEGQFQYRVPSWDKYEVIRNEEHRREYNADKQAEYRLTEKIIRNGVPIDVTKLTPKERKVYEKAVERAQRQIMKKVNEAGEVVGRTKGVKTALAIAQHQVDQSNAGAEQHESEGKDNADPSVETVPEFLQ